MVLQDLRHKIRKTLNFREKSSSADDPASIESDTFLPTELWIQILSDVEQQDFVSLSLTCRYLRWLALPRLFQLQSFYPFSSTITFRRLNRTAYLERTLDRLSFLCTPRIAGLIKAFTLAPYPTGHTLSRRGDPLIPENDVVDRIIEALPTFSNLKTLVLQGIKASPSRFEVLRGLSLEQFTLETRPDDISWYGDDPDCDLAVPIPASQSFTLNRVENLRQTWGESLISLEFLFPSSLTCITAATNGTPSIITALAESQIIFTNLTTLEMSVRFVTMPEFILALSKCPALRILRLRSEATDSTAQRLPNITSIPSNIIRQLSTYHGPPSMAKYFLQGRSVREAILWSSRAPPSVLNSNRLSDIIPVLGDAVTHLELGSTEVSTSLLHIIHQHLPRLSSLLVNTHLSSYHPGVPIRRTVPVEVMTTLSFHLQGLKHFAIGIQVPSSLLPGSREEMEHLKKVIQTFPEKYSPLSWQDWSLEEPWCNLIWHSFTGVEEGRVGSVFIERVMYERPLLSEGR